MFNRYTYIINYNMQVIYLLLNLCFNINIKFKFKPIVIIKPIPNNIHI